MNIGEMVETSVKVWGIINPLSSWAINARTVRYYQSLGLISYPTRKRRSEAVYSNDHVKELLRVLILQRDGIPLNKIKALKDIPMDKFLSIKGLDHKELDKIISKHIPSSVSKEKTHPKKEKAVKKTKAVEENVAKECKPLTVTVTDGMIFEKIHSHLYVGEYFAFLKDIPEDMRKSVYKCLYGQKEKGEVEKAIIEVSAEEPVALPGCTLKTQRTSDKQMTIIIQDKDIYEAGVDTAKVFIMSKERKETTVSATCFCEGVETSTSLVALDKNGCGMLLVPTLFPGQYSVMACGQTCSFQSVSYSLSPFEVSIEKCLAEENKMTLALSVLSYQVPFTGTVLAELVDVVSGDSFGQTTVIEEKQLEVVDGKATVEFDVSSAKGDLSISVRANEDEELIASAPIRGSLKKDREQSLASSLGNIIMVSTIPSVNSTAAKGLHFKYEITKADCPVMLSSCVGHKPILKFNKKVSELTVLVMGFGDFEPVCLNFGDVEEGSTKTIDNIKNDVVFLAVAGFVDGSPWEGKATFVKSDSESNPYLDIKVPSVVSPGQEVNIELSSFLNSSILLKIVDRRMRSQYDALTKMSSAVKSWIFDLIGKEAFGFIAKHVENANNWNQYGFLRGVREKGFGSGWRVVGSRGLVDTQGLDGVTGPTGPTGSSGAMGYSGPTGSFGGGGSYASMGEPMKFSAPMLESTYLCSFNSSVDAVQEQLARTFIDPNTTLEWNHAFGDNLVPKENEVLTSALDLPTTDEKLIPREGKADVIFCDLIRMDETEKVITIKIPDVVGGYEISAFCVSNECARWSQKTALFVSEKRPCVYSFIPSAVHDKDAVDCKAVIVGASKSDVSVTIDGKPVKFLAGKTRNGIQIEWRARAGVHCVSVKTKDGSDSIQQVVESPTEDVFLCQEMMVLKKGQSIEAKDNILSLKVLPGMREEIKVVTEVVKDFSHCCCEQTSAKIMAACLSMGIGSDSDRQAAYESIKLGEARMKTMLTDKGFNMYPETTQIYEHYSVCAARRLSNLGFFLDEDLPNNKTIPDDVKNSIANLVKMGNEVLPKHKKEAYSKYEEAYYDRTDIIPTKEELAADIGYNLCEMAYMAACLLRSEDLEDGVDVANKVAKAAGKFLGGGMHGTYEIIAYLHMLYELKNAGIISESDTSVSVNGKKTTIDKASEMEDVQSIEALKGAVAVRVVSSQKIALDMEKNKEEISIEVIPQTKREEPKDEFAERMENVLWKINLRKGDKVKIKATLKKYEVGDVLYLVLPNCLSVISGGALVKKMQVDFKGKKEIEIEAVATETTKGPQHWTGLVRNMYDPARICSPGLIATTVC